MLFNTISPNVSGLAGSCTRASSVVKWRSCVGMFTCGVKLISADSFEFEIASAFRLEYEMILPKQGERCDDFDGCMIEFYKLRLSYVPIPKCSRFRIALRYN